MEMDKLVLSLTALDHLISECKGLLGKATSPITLPFICSAVSASCKMISRTF